MPTVASTSNRFASRSWPKSFADCTAASFPIRMFISKRIRTSLARTSGGGKFLLTFSRLINFTAWVLIPMKVVSDSDLIAVTCSDAKAVRVGAKRRWRSYGA